MSSLIKHPNRWVLSGDDPEIERIADEQESNLWLANEVPLGRDYQNFSKLDANTQHFLKMTLAFFAFADGLVNENIGLNFVEAFEHPDVRRVYAIQSFIESVHQKTYTDLIKTYASSGEEREDLFEAHLTAQALKGKAEWMSKYMGPEVPTIQKVMAFVLVEGLMFQSSFASIFWCKNQGYDLPGLYFSNEKIAQDEQSHAEFGLLLFIKLLNDEPSGNVWLDVFVEMIEEAVKVEHTFIEEALPVALLGMNPDLMKQYIEHVADYWLGRVGLNPYYNVTNPFPFMENLGVTVKTNFFDTRNPTYQAKGSKDQGQMPDNEDFWRSL